jgi:hypothetical protein
MLYYLFRFLEQWGISGSHMWGYISFRALLALILSLVISAWFGEKFIKYLKSKQITETQRDASIDPFGVKKIGVPSMGGVIIIMAILIPVLLLGRLRNIYLILMLITTVWLGFLGGVCQCSYHARTFRLSTTVATGKQSVRHQQREYRGANHGCHRLYQRNDRHLRPRHLSEDKRYQPAYRIGREGEKRKTRTHVYTVYSCNNCPKSAT